MFAGKFGVSGSFAVIWIFAAELFPTDIRGNALGLGSMAGRIGGFCAPYINELWSPIPWLPPLIYGAFCLFGNLLRFSAFQFIANILIVLFEFLIFEKKREFQPFLTRGLILHSNSLNG